MVAWNGGISASHALRMRLGVSAPPPQTPSAHGSPSDPFRARRWASSSPHDGRNSERRTIGPALGPGAHSRANREDQLAATPTIQHLRRLTVAWICWTLAMTASRCVGGPAGRRSGRPQHPPRPNPSPRQWPRHRSTPRAKSRSAGTTASREAYQGTVLSRAPRPAYHLAFVYARIRPSSGDR